jgi:phosphoadenosine phosphosulfate reductase
MDALEKEAVEFLRTQLPMGERFFVGTSGGKDSIVITEIIKRSGLPYDLFYCLTGIDPPEVVRFLKKQYPEVVFLKPRHTFWHLITTRNPPLVVARWCCESLKKAPGYKLPHRFRVFGIRAEESSRRSKCQRVNEFVASKSGRPQHTQLYPIFQWNEAEVWDYIERRGLPYPAIYDEGFDRVGCVVCPYHMPKAHEMYRARYPAYFNMFERAVRVWFLKRSATGRDMAHETADDFLRDWYRQKASWYRGKGGGA